MVNNEEEKPGLEEFQVLIRKRREDKSDGGGHRLTQLERRRRCRLPQDRSIVGLIKWSVRDS